MKLENERLGNPIEMRFKRGQRAALAFLAEAHEDKQANIVRRFTDFGIKLTKLNGGQIPLIEQVRLQRSFAGLFRKQFRKRSRNRR